LAQEFDVPRSVHSGMNVRCGSRGLLSGGFPCSSGLLGAHW
jgi:hypothetical protein